VFPTIPPPQQRLLVFARLPERGAVKTRLARDAGNDRALAIYTAMLRDALASIGGSSDETEVEVMWAPTPIANAETLRAAFGDHTLAMQTGTDLGERLSMAFSERFFFHRTQKIVAVGVDDPTLPRALVDDAFALLESCEWVVGPAVDGGYYLIGCRGGSFDANIFDGIDWGTERVLGATLERIAGWNATVGVLPERRDIDGIDDLAAVDWKP
jgi:rSAM/selenodomain-associated transferase 1